MLTIKACLYFPTDKHKHTPYCKQFICSKWKVCHFVRKREGRVQRRLMSLVHILVEAYQWVSGRQERHLSLQLSQTCFKMDTRSSWKIKQGTLRFNLHYCLIWISHTKCSSRAQNYIATYVYTVRNQIIQVDWKGEDKCGCIPFGSLEAKREREREKKKRHKLDRIR